MGKSLFGRLNPFGDSKQPTPAAGTPAAAQPRRGLVRAMPRPNDGEVVDQPEAAMRQIVRMQLLAAVAPPKPSAAMRGQLMSNLKQLQEIPALKSLARGFSRVVSRPDVPIEQVVTSVAKDPALSIRILKMANSVEVSSEQRIDRLDVAVQMLGLERVRKTSDALFFLGAGSHVTAGLDWHHLWIHSLGTAAIAERLDRKFRQGDGSVVYIGGLLHDVGKIVLSTLAPEEYKAILVESWTQNKSLEELERQGLGVDHSEAGVAFAEQNQVASSIIDVIKFHSDPAKAQDHRYEVAVVSLANYLAKAYGFGFSGSLIQEGSQAFEDMPAWDMIAESTGSRPYFVDIEEDMQVFTRKLRAELSVLREE